MRDRLVHEEEMLGKGRPAEGQEKIRTALHALETVWDTIGRTPFAR